VEYGPVKETYAHPEHPYTWGLLTSMPRLDRARKTRLEPVPGNPPSLINVPSGCAFHPRCAFRDLVPDDGCRTIVPGLDEAAPGHTARCLIPTDERARVFADVVKPRL
jgi:peptide/nickel transport system ATP-binding protein